MGGIGGGGGGGGGGPGFNFNDNSFEEKEKKVQEKLKKEFEYIENLDDEKTSIFLSHQNRDDSKTQRVHEYANYIEENSDFKVNIDKDFFPKKQITNLKDINKIISENLRKSDIFIAIYHPVKESSRHERSEWYNLEAKKAKHWGKPIVHVFLEGSHNSGVVETSKSYKIHYKKDEHWRNDLLKQIKVISSKHQL